jgi:pyridoxamine 5'-phosphate oxidase
VTGLDPSSLPQDPLALLATWIEQAGGLERVEAVAMSLATLGPLGRPSARMVLLRGLDERGLRFYTSYDSRKGRELAENPEAAAVLHWLRLERQVRVEGVVSKLSDEESDTYFLSRPRGHQLAAWASEQSEPIESREVLEERYAHFDRRFEGLEVPRPHSWGGYLLAPRRFEFWQGRPNRLHDRIEYVLAAHRWCVARLAP